MSEPRACVARCYHDHAYCENCDRLVGLPGVHVLHVDRHAGGLVVAVESPVLVMGCPTCGVVARSHGRRTSAAGRYPLLRRPDARALAQAHVDVS